MDASQTLPLLLAAAWLLPLASFAVIVLFGPRLGKHGVMASYIATGAILSGFVLSLTALGVWLNDQGVFDEKAHGGGHHARSSEPAPLGLALSSVVPPSGGRSAQGSTIASPPEGGTTNDVSGGASQGAEAPYYKLVSARQEHAAESRAAGSHDEHHAAPPPHYNGDWYALGIFGSLRVTIGYYIDSLTVAMFCMVTLIATLIHFYAIGYMHDELHDVTDHEVHLAGGHHLHRPGRFHRFFQYLSLFCFSMLGLVIAGNIAMVFVFWELVGICSYFLIGFYIERKSASTAANKAFIVNRVGDFGMIIGLMALFGALGTFAFGDTVDDAGNRRPGLFSLVRPAENDYRLTVPEGMIKAAARPQVAEVALDHTGLLRDGELSTEERRSDLRNLVVGANSQAAVKAEEWRQDSEVYNNAYWLLVIAGVGIFCGCVGKSAQFPLHVWLPDAMEGPTPVSALVHSATMVAAGVYLVGRFYPVFTPEVLLTIAYIGTITLFLAATIAITATDIKRVLAYSTVSQLGYMMLALGVGGWAAGLFHLITHAFFKSLLFMCSGSVIHACHTNEMPKMGGLRHKMPWTAYTMLVGCLAIAGAGIPLTAIGLSGYYSKDAIIAQALSFRASNPLHGWVFYVAAAGAAITAFYMFRVWYMTFAGEPRDKHIYEHAHESPPVMYVPLVILAVFAIGVGWSLPMSGLSVTAMLEQARPAGPTGDGLLASLHYPDEHLSHLPEFHNAAGLIASATAVLGFTLATLFYGVRVLNPEDVRRQFGGLYTFLRNKWYFDELYNAVFVRPTLFLARCIADFDKKVIDWFIDNTARWTLALSRFDDLIDRYFVDGFVNVLANWTYSFGIALRAIQTGRLRQYVMFIVVGTVALFVMVSFYLSAYAGN